MTSAFRFPLIRFKNDPALQPGGPGERKCAITELYDHAEHLLRETEWYPPESADATAPVVNISHTEIAVFTNDAKQDRHYHNYGTEIYEVLEGLLTIEVDGTDHMLSQGDMLIVTPGATHLVKPGDIPFLCRVISANCRGKDDKYTV